VICAGHFAVTTRVEKRVPQSVSPLSLSMAIQPLDLVEIFRILNIIYNGYENLNGGSARREATTYIQNITIQKKRTQISVPRVGLEVMIEVFERTKKVHDLDGVVSMIF
jgi:hypothetical protein